MLLKPTVSAAAHIHWRCPRGLSNSDMGVLCSGVDLPGCVVQPHPRQWPRRALAKALQVNDALTYININHNRFGAPGRQALTHSLLNNPNSKLGWMTDNQFDLRPGKGEVITEGRIDTDSLALLASVLAHNDVLVSLALQGANVQYSGADALAGMLRVNGESDLALIGCFCLCGVTLFCGSQACFRGWTSTTTR